MSLYPSQALEEPGCTLCWRPRSLVTTIPALMAPLTTLSLGLG